VLWRPRGEVGKLFLLDGRNRLDAMGAAAATIDYPGLLGDILDSEGNRIASGAVKLLFADVEPYAYVVSANIHRRHLTAEQKRELIAKLLKATPEKSNRQIAETVKASHVTVGAVRAEMESTGQIDQLAKTVGKDRKARSKPPLKIEAVRVGDSEPDRDLVIGTAIAIARMAANAERPAVFCPPIAVFKIAEHARQQDLLQAPTLTVECDREPTAARRKLELLLGPATLVVRSGGVWTNGNGESEDKLHLHWRWDRLSSYELEKVKEARSLAQRIVHADASGVPAVHPFRWPGSWHRKQQPPRLCEIIAFNPERELNVDAALELLRAAAPPVSAKRRSKAASKQKRARKTKTARVSDGGTDQSPSGKFYGKCALFFEAFWTDEAIEQQFRTYPERYDDVARYLQEERLRSQIEDCRAHWLGEWGVTLKDFYTFLPKGDRYIFIPTGDLWPGSSVDVRLPPVPLFKADGSPILNKNDKQIVLAPSEWLAQNRRVDQMTWAPGEPMLIEGKLMTESGWVARDGVSCFNLYRPPKIDGGDPSKAAPWLDHIDEIYPNDVGHIVSWCAHRVQRPGDKINHALLLIGEQGVGKDSLLEPVRRAMGPGNAHDIRPKDLFAPQNEFVQSTLLTINEVHDLGEVSRFDFYDGMKIYTAAPPDTLRVNVKYVPQYYVPNVCGVVMTSNHKAGGVYLPPDDRRTYAASSDRSKDDFREAYWNKLWGYYEKEGGFAHVAAYLRAYDLSGFNAKAPPPRTATWWGIVDSNRAPEEGELADVLDKLGNPHAVTLVQIIRVAKSGRPFLLDFYEWINDRKNRRVVPHRMEKCGYVPVRNDAAEDGLWKIEGKRQAVYARKNLSHVSQVKAARNLASGQ
jgi:hypothetical protein